MADGLVVSDDVRAALAAGRPVVALESALIAHGLPRPQNLEVATLVEATVRDGGALPATVGVIGGRLVVGLDANQLELIACAENVRKCSRRDLPVAIANGEHGATTVAGTLAAMGLAGLRVLATGGIGGVHRGAELSFDVSADLVELARTRAIVVAAGAKAVLDLPRTLELLETLGVPVLGWRSDDFAAFYSGSSGLPVSSRVDSAADAARAARAAWDLDLAKGLLLAVPPPPDSALEREEVERAVAEALAAAEGRGLRGPALTPFLLDTVASATGGRSLQANVDLLQNNARVAAEVAFALTRDEGRYDAATTRW